MGASTPHFALHLRKRIRTLISGLSPGHPARIEGGARDRAARTTLALGARAQGQGGHGRALHAEPPRHKRSLTQPTFPDVLDRARLPRSPAWSSSSDARTVPTASTAARSRGRFPSASTRPRCDRGSARWRACRSSARCRTSECAQRRVYFELRDAHGALPCSMWRKRLRPRRRLTLENGAQVVLAGGCDYYPGSATSSPSFSFRATARCGSPARASCSRRSSGCAASSTARGCSGRRSHCPPGAAPLDRSGDGRGRQGARRRAGRASPARMAGPAGLGLRARAGPPRGTRHRARAAGPGGAREGGRDRRRARRRLGNGPDGVLRRDALPHRGHARRAGDRVGGTPHRPHADRRRGGGLAARRRRTPPRARCGWTRARPVRPWRPRRGAAAPVRATARCSSARAGWPRSRALPTEHVARHRARLHQKLRELRASGRRGCRDPQRSRRAAPARAGAQGHGRGRRARRAPAPPSPRRAQACAACVGKAIGRRARDLERLRAGARRHTIRSARSSAATRSSRTRGARWSRAPRPRREARELSVRFHDDRVRARVEDPEKAVNEASPARTSPPRSGSRRSSSASTRARRAFARRSSW